MRLLASLLAACFVSHSLSAEPSAAKAAKPPSASLRTLAASLTTAQTSTLLAKLNRGDHLALIELPGIGSVRAGAIQRSRPFASPLELLRVSGIGEAIVSDILHHARAGYPKRNSKVKPPRRE